MDAANLISIKDIKMVKKICSFLDKYFPGYQQLGLSVNQTSKKGGAQKEDISVAFVCTKCPDILNHENCVGFIKAALSESLDRQISYLNFDFNFQTLPKEENITFSLAFRF